jgi:membrane protein
MADDRSFTDRLRRRIPSVIVEIVENASRHQTLTLAAGLAFFGIISIGPAVGVGFGLMRLVASPEAADSLVELLQDTFTEQFGLADLLEQMEDRAGRYAGIGLAVLLWPATTLASGWTRALDAIAEVDSAGGLRGLRGRLRALAPAGILIAAMFLLFAVVTFGAAAFDEGPVLFAGLIAGGIVVQYLLNLVIYRWLPTESWPWSILWKGAGWATLGTILSTVGFGIALTLGEGIADQYPPALTTAIIIGGWLYAANASLLLGAEYLEVRA